jgi:hypothetical protein
MVGLVVRKSRYCYSSGFTELRIRKLALLVRSFYRLDVELEGIVKLLIPEVYDPQQS